MWHLDDQAAVQTGASWRDDPGLNIIDCEQNSEAWDIARMGIPTASAYDKVITRGRPDRPSATRRKYMLRLLGERLLGEPAQNIETPDTIRGHVMEPDAVVDYELVSGNTTETVGLMVRDGMGASLDRLIVGQRGFAEIKSKKPELQLAVILADEMPKEHKPQVQGGLMVSGLDWCDFVSYWPGLPLFVKRVYRDETYIDWLRAEIQQFNRELDALEHDMRERYYSGVAA